MRLLCWVALVCCWICPVQAQPICKVPASITQFQHPMPVFRAALKRSDEPIRIVALGSSSTSGAGASSKERTYPAMLKRHLTRTFEGHSFVVANRGKGGELAGQMLARLERDVLSLKPHLVIWQTGVNDALRRINAESFRATVTKGIKAIRASGGDVVLLDQQHYPKAASVTGYLDYVMLIMEIGQEHRVPVFRRYDLMRHLVDSAQYEVEDLLAPDKFHLNDRSYACVGDVLATALANSALR